MRSVDHIRGDGALSEWPGLTLPGGPIVSPPARLLAASETDPAVLVEWALTAPGVPQCEAVGGGGGHPKRGRCRPRGGSPYASSWGS